MSGSTSWKRKNAVASGRRCFHRLRASSFLLSSKYSRELKALEGGRVHWRGSRRRISAIRYRGPPFEDASRLKLGAVNYGTSPISRVHAASPVN